MRESTTYLDHAAATPVDAEVLAAMQPYFSDKFYNPSANYAAAQAVASDIERARAEVAHWLGARSREITLTAGGTEANNLAIHGILRQYPGANVVVSSIEHESVLQPAAQYNCKQAKVDEQGIIDLADLWAKVDDSTVLISVMYANNEVGSLQPLRDITQRVTKTRVARRKAGNLLPLYVHTDACQAANYLDLHTARLGIDLMTLNGGKIYGPKQSGALFVKAGIMLGPLIMGGGQEYGLRSGTENVPGVIGLAAALNKAQGMRADEVRRLHALQQYFFEELAAKLPTATINGSRKKRLPNNVHITVPGADNERLLVQLDEAGILAAAGSACSASNEEPSHVLRAMGVSDVAARSSLRLTMGRTTTKADVHRTVKTLVDFTA